LTSFDVVEENTLSPTAKLARIASHGIFQIGGELATLETGVCVGSQSRTATIKKKCADRLGIRTDRRLAAVIAPADLSISCRAIGTRVY
jgi:hypothetical protein